MKTLKLILIVGFLVFGVLASSVFARVVWVRGRLGENGKMTRGYYKNGVGVNSQYSKPKYSLYNSR